METLEYKGYKVKMEEQAYIDSEDTRDYSWLEALGEVRY